MPLRTIIFFSLTCLMWSKVLSRHIPEILEVSIYHQENVTSFSFTPFTGRYLICNQEHEKLLEIRPYHTLVIEKTDNGFAITLQDSTWHSAETLTLQGGAFHNSFMIMPLDWDTEPRVYEGDLTVSSLKNSFRLINAVPLESYVAGTVQSESGYNRHQEFYKVQATIIRTYALKNLNRHQREGFHLCDKVHCQAYYGKSVDSAIVHAVDDTRGMVVVDQNNNLINTVYHANCGGQTVNSEDLWIEALPYLRSNQDTFCLQWPGSAWKASISMKDFEVFLNKKFNFHPSPSEWKKITAFRQNRRKHYLDTAQRIHLKHVRDHFGLRSTYFSIQLLHDTLHLKGKGYGHGVGLCQEGAMSRALHGQTKQQILRFYYQNSRIQILETPVHY